MVEGITGVEFADFPLGWPESQAWRDPAGARHRVDSDSSRHRVTKAILVDRPFETVLRVDGRRRLPPIDEEQELSEESIEVTVSLLDL